MTITPRITFRTTNDTFWKNVVEKRAGLKARLARWLSPEKSPADQKPDDGPNLPRHYEVTVSLKQAKKHDHRHFVLPRAMRKYLERYDVPTNFPKKRLVFSDIEIVVPPKAKLSIQVVKPPRSLDGESPFIVSSPEKSRNGTQTVLVEKDSVLYVLDRRPAANGKLSVLALWIGKDRDSPNDTAYLGVRLIAPGFTPDDGKSKMRLNKALEQYFLERKERQRASRRKSRTAIRS